MSTIASKSTDTSALATLGLASTAGSTAAAKKALGQADFLRLMTEQLKNQDPLKPMEGTQMVAQLAQFSTVQGIDSMQNAMGSMASVMESDQTLRAATLVGHDALVAASSLTLQAGAGVRGEVQATSAGPMQVEVLDASGQVVRRIAVTAPAAGGTEFAWDGKFEDGSTAPAGRYSLRATLGTGQDAQGQDVRVASHVDSVSIEATGLVLNLSGLGSVPLSAIRRIG